MRCQFSLSLVRVPLRTSDVRNLAAILQGTVRSFDSALYAVLAREATPDERIEAEAALLTEHGLVRCKGCDVWVGTTEIDPDDEDRCYPCTERLATTKH